MSIFNMLGGVWGARKVATSASGLWKDTVNYMLHSGRTPDLSDSTYFLSESYSLCVFAYVCTHANQHSDRIGAVVVETNRLVGEFAKSVWSEQLPNRLAVAKASDLTASLPNYYDEWQSRALDAMTRTETSTSGKPGAFVQTGIGIFVFDIASWSLNSHRPLEAPPN